MVQVGTNRKQQAGGLSCVPAAKHPVQGHNRNIVQRTTCVTTVGRYNGSRAIVVFYYA